MTPLSLLSALWLSQAHWWDTSFFALILPCLSFKCFSDYLRCLCFCVSVFYDLFSHYLNLIVVFSIDLQYKLSLLLLLQQWKLIFIFALCFSVLWDTFFTLYLLLLIKGLCLFCSLCSFLSCVYFFLLASLTVFSLFFVWNKGSSELGVKLCRSPLGWSENNTWSYFCNFCTHLWPESEQDHITSEQFYILFIENCIRTAHLGL